MQMRYRREIDGLRAVAVLAVILFHAGFSTFSGGYVGVDVFFVISGYLITSIILAELEVGTFTLTHFYERRARRILPALFLVLAAQIPLALIYLLPNEIKELSGSLTYVVLFLSNIFFYDQRGYFDTAAELKPLLHTWSLAVEEQFYVFFPLLVLLLWRRTKIFAPLALIVGIASLAYSQHKLSTNPHAAFFLMQSRVWELLIGALLAYHMSRTHKEFPASPGKQLGSAVGLLLILAAVLLFDSDTPFPGLRALVPTIGTALLIYFSSPTTYVGRILGSRALVGIGLISYSAYLWHQPLFAFARQASITEPGAAAFAALSLGSLGLAYISWRFVEQPFRKKGAVSRRAIFSVAAIGTGLFATLGLIGSRSDGLASLYSSEWDQRQLAIWNNKSSVAGDNGDCHMYTPSVSDIPVDRFKACYRKYGKALVVIGDSHGRDMYGALETNSGRSFIVGLTKPGCRAHTPGKTCYYDAFRSFLATYAYAIDAVIYTQAGFYLIQNERGVEGKRSFFARRTVPVYGPNTLFIDRVLTYLDSLARYTKVIWIGPRIEPHLNTLKLKKLAMSCEISSLRIRDTIVRTFDQLDDFIADRAAKVHQIRYLSSVDALAFDAAADLYDCKSVYWADGDHWSASGEMRFGKRIYSALLANKLL